jgi:hypothetical protein
VEQDVDRVTALILDRRSKEKPGTIGRDAEGCGSSKFSEVVGCREWRFEKPVRIH